MTWTTSTVGSARSSSSEAYAIATPEGLGAGRAPLGGAAEDATNLDPDAAKRLHVDGADEARPDHRGTDARDPARHAVLTWVGATTCLDILHCGLRPVAVR